MNTASPSESQVVRIVWAGKQAPTDVLLRDVKGAVNSSRFWPKSIECEAIDAVDALDILSSIADPDIGSVLINGVEARIVTSPSGEYRFIPTDETDGVEVLEYGSSSWVPGGPCVMEQQEQICRYGDLYWVEASGDSVSQCVFVGRYPDRVAGVIAAVEASIYFSIDSGGIVRCELNEGPQDK